MADLGQALAHPRADPQSYGEKPSWQEGELELRRLIDSEPESYTSLIDPLSPRDADYHREVAHLKRFIECWRADRSFRELVKQRQISNDSPELHGAEINPEHFRPYWDAATPGGEDPPESRAVQRYRFFTREKLLHREKLRCVECAPEHAGHRVWRERQIRRSLSHLGPRAHDGIVHAPFAIELSEGCSVGCWFCGVSAKRKGGDYLYSDQNAREWRQVLGVLTEKLGYASRTGFLYWASDPLDNPDYEKFGEDFAAICGRFPQTTTSLAARDIERTRRLLRRSIQLGCTINRFSILSLSHFRKIMQGFTPEELLYCELVCQNPEATLMQSSAGRARGTARLRERAARIDEEAAWQETPGTIACVSGFLINMVTRTIRLITPCPATPRWPNGYWVLDSATFQDASEFSAQLDSLLENNCRGHLRHFDQLAFRSDLEYDTVEAGFRLSAREVRKTYRSPANGEPSLYGLLGAGISCGSHTAGSLALHLEDHHSIPADRTFSRLNYLFSEGELDEEPPN